MPTDPNHRALLRAVASLTTQVKRIADHLADGTAQDAFALVPPVVTDDDGAQTTGDDTGPFALRTIAHWGPVCESGRHLAHASQTCEEADAFTEYVQTWAQMNSAAEWRKTAAVYSGLHTTAEDEVKQLRAELEEATAAIKRVRDVQAWLTRNYPGLKEPASRLFLALNPANKEG
ncbi:hypothetical protein ABZ154_03675 [Streptomyces sp. NPDC006261]|uniref:hypothetical protein n=1 Tax=Streptomyces sp. NPDC006261 TaxID=3156739 RepID=UPI0033A8CF93